jgi:Flp pilus assembly protein CpaB
VTNKLALVVAVALGILSILGIKVYVGNIIKQNEIMTEPVDCLVAAHDIPAGRAFTAEDIESHQFPRAAIEAGLKTSRVTDRNTVIGAKVVFPIAEGQILQTYHFPAIGRPIGKRFATELKPDQRAITIPISRVSGVAGLLRPSDNVDIVCYTTFTDQNAKSVAVTFTAFSSVLVLATDAITDPYDVNAGTGYSTITLRLSADDANTLLHNMYSGAALHLLYVPAGAAGSTPGVPKTSDKIWEEIRAQVQGH